MIEMETKRRSLDKVKNVIGWSVGPVCELDFEILHERDKIHGGKGKCQSPCEPLSEFLTWMKCLTVYSAIHTGNLGFIFKFSHPFTPPSNQGAHSQGCLYNSCTPLAKEVLQNAGYKVALCSQRNLVEC